MQRQQQYITPRQFTAVYLEKIGYPMYTQLQPQYKLQNDGDMIVRVEAAPINPSDLYSIKGQMQALKPCPFIPGAEGAGLVLAAKGKQAEELIGKRIAFVNYFGPSGTYAQYALANASQALPIPDIIPSEVAACSYINPITVQAMYEKVKRAGVKTVVNNAAASQVGRMLVRKFQKSGLNVICIVRRQEQVDILQKLGAKYILNENDQDFKQQLTKLCADLSATIFFDAVSGDATQTIAECLPAGSQILIYGMLSKQGFAKLSLDQIFKGLSIKGFHLSELFMLPENEVKQAIKEITQSLATDYRTQISKTYNLRQINEAVEYYSKNMTKGKVIIKP